jgi:hypothetical protein
MQLAFSPYRGACARAGDCAFTTVLVTASTFTGSAIPLVILLCGGDKTSQARDINIAKRLLDEWVK